MFCWVYILLCVMCVCVSGDFMIGVVMCVVFVCIVWVLVLMFYVVFFVVVFFVVCDFVFDFDVVVVGGGYVGIEVVVVVVRKGVCMVLVMLNLYKMIGEMSCNFFIGGLGKGTFAREVDVFDGLMVCVVDGGGI